MKELIRLFVQIAILRRGPQDLPASPLLLGLAGLACLAVSFVVAAVLPPVQGWAAQIPADMLFTLVWYVLLLRIAGRPERTLQTLTALFGLQAVLAPPLFASEWAMRVFGQDSPLGKAIAVLGLGVLVWLVVANSRVLQAALEWPALACLGLVLLKLFSSEFFLVALFSGSAAG
jgi:hypothetical protein